MKIPDARDVPPKHIDYDSTPKTAVPIQIVPPSTPDERPSSRRKPYDDDRDDDYDRYDDGYDDDRYDRFGGRRRRRGAYRGEPHRGQTIFILGLLGLLVCCPLGIVAWIWANEDLRKMASGEMDPEGKSNTETGRVLGMIATILGGIGLAIVMLYFCCIFGVLINARH